jgi:threonine dehydratase
VPLLSEQLGGRVLVQCENLQRTGSFKFRGAYNAVSTLDETDRGRGVVAVSSGNHAQGVAEAARLFGVKATIVMPADAPAMKRARTERSGATVVTYDRATQDREAVAAEILARQGGIFIHPYNDPYVIAGQGTVGLEVAQDCLALGVVPNALIAPASGGGLIAGIALGLHSEFPEAAIGLAEPAGFDDYTRSLAAGAIMRNEATAGSLCDALLATAPGPIGFAINRAAGTRGHVVSDAEALAAVAFAFNELKLVVEPGGAVALAVLLAGRVPVAGRTVVVVLSGGNIEGDMLARALATA